MFERDQFQENKEAPAFRVLDEYLEHEVKDALLYGTESAGIDVQVRVVDGVVLLGGVVDVLSHKRTAEEIARRVPGVRKVENDITVANEEQFTDKQLLDEINGKLGHKFPHQQVGARVHKGVVTLVGHAGSHPEMWDAVRYIEGMPGVREVRMGRIKVGEGREGDDRDTARAAERILDDMGYNHRLFEVFCAAGRLVIRGFVPTREDRSRIKTALHQISGVHKLDALLIPEDEGVDEVH